MKTLRLSRLIIARAVAIIAALLAFKARADLFVSSQTPPEMMRFDGVTGAYVSAAPTPTDDLLGLTFGPDGNLYAAADSAVLRFDGKTGSLLGTFASGLQGAINLTFG